MAKASRPGGTYASGALDMVVQNTTIIDAVAGIVKADIGIRDGRIVGIGKAGNPHIMNGVATRLRCGPNTTVVHADGFIVTAGGIEAHAHFISPQQCWHALAGGVTTMIGMTPGPHFDVSCSAGMSPQERRATGELLAPIKPACSLLIVEHDLDFIKDICDTLTVLDDGQVITSGPTRRVQDDERVRKAYLD
jgi:urease alpha subunit